MVDLSYLPLYELSRSETVESLHYGAVAVVNANGDLVAGYGNPDVKTFLRSSAKPFQALPFVENGGPKYYGFEPNEIAILCASHSGTDEHVSTLRSIQAKIGVSEDELLCGVHLPIHKPTAEVLRQRNQEPTPNRHNCSGKHTGMLAYSKMLFAETGRQPAGSSYLDNDHPVQVEILKTFAEMCGLTIADIALGVDGCSAPNFAVRLCDAAGAFARICDPVVGRVSPEARVEACHTIVSAMMAYPNMVAGPGRFDTRLMEVTKGRILAKGGAEAYQGIGIRAGALGPGLPALGIAIKISDGDARQRVRSAVALEVLRQLQAISPAEAEALSEFGPCLPIHNWRKIVTGQAYPIFELNWTDAGRNLAK